MDRQLEKRNEPQGGVLFDPSEVTEFDAGIFSIDYWRSRKAVLGSAAGRGTAWIVGDRDRPWVLRQYHRGGWAQLLYQRSYFWTGEGRARPFAECRLLSELCNEGLPVPIPVAARYIRQGPFYQGDLITVFIQQTESLAQKCDKGHVDEDLWVNIGQTLRRFHDNGVDHRDLNANNILIDDTDSVFLVDFDRCRRRSQGVWAQRNLSRLERSLRKLATQRGGAFPAVGWRALKSGYSDS